VKVSKKLLKSLIRESLARLMTAPDDGTFLREAIGIIIQESYNLYKSLPDQILGKEKSDPRTPLRFIMLSKADLRGMVPHGRDFLMGNENFLIGQFLLLGQKIDRGEIKADNLSDLGDQFTGIFLGTPGMNLHIELLIKSIFGKMYITRTRDNQGSYGSYEGPDGRRHTYLKRSPAELSESFNEYFKPFLLKLLQLSEQDLELKDASKVVSGTTTYSTTIEDLEDLRIGFSPATKRLKYFYDLLENLDDDYLKKYLEGGTYSNIKKSGNARAPDLLKILGEYLYHVQLYKNDPGTIKEAETFGLDMQAFENLLEQKISLIKNPNL